MISLYDSSDDDKFDTNFNNHKKYKTKSARRNDLVVYGENYKLAPRLEDNIPEFTDADDDHFVDYLNEVEIEVSERGEIISLVTLEYWAQDNYHGFPVPTAVVIHSSQTLRCKQRNTSRTNQYRMAGTFGVFFIEKQPKRIAPRNGGRKPRRAY